MKGRKTRQLKIVFFGLGSIGKKHAKIIRDNYNFELFAYRTNRGQEKNTLNIPEYTNLEEIFALKPDIAFITNPTFLHTDTALECTKRNISLFIEKPISHNLKNTEELEKEIKKRNLFSYVAYNMRFHPVITQLKKILSEEKQNINFNVVCRSYLPDWRPKQDYTKSYSAIKEMGGGVLLDLSHEFDYINWLFGDIQKIDGECGKKSSLNVDTEDFVDAKITCKHNIKGNLHLDFFTKEKERKIKIFLDNKTFEGDLINNTIKIIENGKEKTIKTDKTTEDTYKMQIDYFFRQYLNKEYNNMNNFSEALITFKKIMDFKEKHCQKQ